MSTDIEKLVTEIHTTVKNWETNGLPSCGVHGERIRRLQEDTKWIKTVIYSVAGVLIVGLIGLVVEGGLL